MQKLVRSAMEQGAFGFSSSLSGPPGSWIDTNTLIAMCKVASKLAVSTRPTCEPKGKACSSRWPRRFDWPGSARSRRYHSHQLADHNLWGKMPELIATIRQARASGQQVEADVYPVSRGTGQSCEHHPSVGS